MMCSLEDSFSFDRTMYVDSGVQVHSKEPSDVGQASGRSKVKAVEKMVTKKQCLCSTNDGGRVDYFKLRKSMLRDFDVLSLRGSYCNCSHDRQCYQNTEARS